MKLGCCIFLATRVQEVKIVPGALMQGALGEQPWGICLGHLPSITRLKDRQSCQGHAGMVLQGSVHEIFI